MNSRQMGHTRRLPLSPLRWLLILVLLFATPNFLFAQGCALCYTQAAGAGSRLIHALRSDEYGFMPLTNIWCPHTRKLSNPMEIIE